MKKAVNEFLDLVEDAQDRIIGLANDLNANSHRVEWSIEDEGDGEVKFRCRVQCTFGRFDNYHCGSYVSLNHPFEEAEESIREMHSKWAADNDRYERKREEEEIKQRLYDEYLQANSRKTPTQLSSTTD